MLSVCACESILFNIAPHRHTEATPTGNKAQCEFTWKWASRISSTEEGTNFSSKKKKIDLQLFIISISVIGASVQVQGWMSFPVWAGIMPNLTESWTHYHIDSVVNVTQSQTYEMNRTTGCTVNLCISGHFRNNHSFLFAFSGVHLFNSYITQIENVVREKQNFTHFDSLSCSCFMTYSFVHINFSQTVLLNKTTGDIWPLHVGLINESI